MTAASLHLPPAFRLHLVVHDQTATAALRAAIAEGDAEDGDVFWNANRPDLDVAIALTPEADPVASTQIVPVATVALIEALGAIAPPQVAVQVAWPASLIINGAATGGLRLDVFDGLGQTTALDQAVWFALSLKLSVQADQSQEPGEQLRATSLAEEGMHDLAPADVLDAFARHFLFWTHRWHDQGLDAVRMEWNHRALGFRDTIDVSTPAGAYQGRHKGLAPNGDLALGDERLPLAPAVLDPEVHRQSVAPAPCT